LVSVRVVDLLVVALQSDEKNSYIIYAVMIW
jgi:hypothetical protein